MCLQPHISSYLYYTIHGQINVTRKGRNPDPLVKVNSTQSLTASTLLHPASPIECLRYLPNVRAIQYKLGPAGKVDPARKFKCTTAAREGIIHLAYCPGLFYTFGY